MAASFSVGGPVVVSYKNLLTGMIKNSCDAAKENCTLRLSPLSSDKAQYFPHTYTALILPFRMQHSTSMAVQQSGENFIERSPIIDFGCGMT